METEETLKNQYHMELQKLEEQEDRLSAIKNETIIELDGVSDRVRYFLRDLTPNNEYMEKSLHQLENLKEETNDIIHFEKKKVQHELDNLEESYYQSLKRLTNN